MNKGYIIMAVLLLASIVGTYFVFIRYVLPMQQELVAHEDEATALYDKIVDLEKTFDKGRPEEVIQNWQRGKQPWVGASNSRTGYFKLEEIEEIEIPENEYPRFWYIEEYPKLEDSLYQTAAERRIILGRIDFGVELPGSFEGKNPSAEEILKEINKYNYGIEMTKFIFDANPTRVDEVTIWPMKSIHKGKTGELFVRTIGYKIEIQYEELLKFLSNLNNSESFITVDAIRITKKELRRPKRPVNVELLITDANFVVAKTSGSAPGVGSVDPDAAGRFQGLFGVRAALGRDSDDEEEDAPGFFAKIINFFKGLMP